MQSSSKSYLSNLCGQLAIVCLNSCRDLQTILICCDMSFWCACVVGVGISENFSFSGFSRIFCLLVHFAIVLFVYKQASAHHVMNTDTGWHRHAEETTKYATRVEFHKNTKADFIAMFRWRRRERCGCKWGDEVGMNDIPFTINRGGAHCGAGNREAWCKLFKLPVYRAFLPDTLPHTPVLHIELQNSLKCCFPKRLGPNMKYKVYNFHPRRGTYKIDHRSQINILRT